MNREARGGTVAVFLKMVNQNLIPDLVPQMTVLKLTTVEECQPFQRVPCETNQ